MNTVLIESINSRAISNNVINRKMKWKGTSQLYTLHTQKKTRWIIRLNELIILETNECTLILHIMKMWLKQMKIETKEELSKLNCRRNKSLN